MIYNTCTLDEICKRFPFYCVLVLWAFVLIKPYPITPCAIIAHARCMTGLFLPFNSMTISFLFMANNLIEGMPISNMASMINKAFLVLSNGPIKV